MPAAASGARTRPAFGRTQASREPDSTRVGRRSPRLEGIDAHVGSLVVEPPIEGRRHRRAVRVEDDDSPAGCQRPRRLVQEPRRPSEMVEHVDEDEVRERTVLVRKILGCRRPLLPTASARRRSRRPMGSARGSARSPRRPRRTSRRPARDAPPRARTSLRTGRARAGGHATSAPALRALEPEATSWVLCALGGVAVDRQRAADGCLPGEEPRRPFAGSRRRARGGGVHRQGGSRPPRAEPLDPRAARALR